MKLKVNRTVTITMRANIRYNQLNKEVQCKG